MRKCIINKDVVFNELEIGNTVSKEIRNCADLQVGSQIEGDKVHFEVEPQDIRQGEADEDQRPSEWFDQDVGISSGQIDLRGYNLTRDKERRSVRAHS